MDERFAPSSLSPSNEGSICERLERTSSNNKGRRRTKVTLFSTFALSSLSHPRLFPPPLFAPLKARIYFFLSKGGRVDFLQRLEGKKRSL
jgi:hypothetical protein